MAIADGGGLTGLTIRSLATSLQTKPMSLYRTTCGNKDETLDGRLWMPSSTRPNCRFRAATGRQS